MAIALIKAPGGATEVLAARASCDLYMSNTSLPSTGSEPHIPIGSVFTFVTGNGTFTGTTTTDYISSWVNDIANSFKTFLTTVLGADYTITLKEGSTAEEAWLSIVAKADGAAYNFTSFTLATGVTAVNIVNATNQYCYPVFSNNDYEFVFSTTDYITNAGAKSERFLNVTGKPANGQHLILTNGIKTFDFVFTNVANTANNTPLRLLAYTGFETNLDQANAIIDGLKRNYYLDNNYEISIQSFISGTAKIKIQGKTTTVPLLTATTLPSNVAQDGTLVNATPATYSANYRFFCDLFKRANPNQKVLELDGIPDAANQITYTKITTALHKAILQSVPNFEYAGVPIDLGNYYKFILKCCDYFGALPEEKLYKQFPAGNYFLVLPGAASGQRITDEYLLPYFTGATTKFLTSLVNGGCDLATNQPQYLSAFINKPTGTTVVTIKFKLYYTDGTSSAVLGTTNSTLNNQSIATFACGYNQLNVDALKDATKNVLKYEVWLANGSTALTEKFMFFVDNNYYRHNRFFVFINGFGQPEVLSMRGSRSITANTTKTINTLPQNSRDEENAVYNGQEQVNETGAEINYTIFSGSRKKWEHDYFINFLLSETIYELLPDKLMAITITGNKTELGDDRATYFSFSFEYKYAITERGNA